MEVLPQRTLKQIQEDIAKLVSRRIHSVTYVAADALPSGRVLTVQFIERQKRSKWARGLEVPRTQITLNIASRIMIGIGMPNSQSAAYLISSPLTL